MEREEKQSYAVKVIDPEKQRVRRNYLHSISQPEKFKDGIIASSVANRATGFVEKKGSG